MQVKNILISIASICIVVLLPHAGLLPSFLYSIPILLFVWIYLKYFGEKFSDIGFSFKSFSLKSVLIGSVAAIVILSFMQLIFFPVLEHFIQFEDTDVELYSFIRENIWTYSFIVIMGWVIGGFYEEIVFHGFIFTRLEKILPAKYSLLFSFLITSILFGLYHIQLGPLGMINAFVVGSAYLGLAIYFKRNLWYSIISHGMYDTIVITLIYLGYL